MATQHAALIRFQNACRAVNAAAEACVHWDYESREDGSEHECCREYADALKERKLARDAYRKVAEG